MGSGFDAAEETRRLTEWLRDACLYRLRRRGAVIGVSGGVDSATVLSLAVQALGRDRVLAVLLPDRDSSADSEILAREVARALGVSTVRVDITEALAGAGCYDKRDAAIRSVVPAYDASADKVKIVLPQDLLESASLNVFSVVVVKPNGEELRARAPGAALQEIVAATNMKQRMRMTMLYNQAECRNLAVVGTTNKNEHDLGFFVKHGDGAADVQPIRHLFKSQVYQMACQLKVPSSILARPPTTDTYSAECSQEEFFYRVPFKLLDAVWQSAEKNESPSQAAERLGMKVGQVENILNDLRRKQRATESLRMGCLLPPEPAAQTTDRGLELMRHRRFA